MDFLRPGLRTIGLLPWIAGGLACSSEGAPARDTGDDDAADGDAVSDDVGDAAPEVITPSEEIRVVSLNLRCLIDDWDARLPILVDELAAIDPHLMGLQEVCAERGVRDALVELVAGLEARTHRTYATHRRVTHIAWQKYEEGIAIVGVAPFEATNVVALPGGTFPRSLLLVRVSRPDAAALVFATTHLDHQSALARKGQAEAVAAALDDFAGDDEAIVLTGDLNEAPGAGEVHATLTAAGLVDVWAAIFPDDPGPTFPATSPTERIDYVWLNASTSGLGARSMMRILATPVGGTYGSDHLGLTATMAP